MDPQMDSMSDSKANKHPIVRGARACTVCRAAKMKCVGAEEGQRQCQRCKRANVECVFEKHKRGRKPGSKLSEASKMLRRLEKGLNSAKIKTQPSEPTSPYQTDELRSPQQEVAYPMRPEPVYGPPSATYSMTEPPPAPPHAYQPYQHQEPYPASNSSRTADVEDDDEDPDKNDAAFYPAKLIDNQKRNSFFRTILNPEDTPSAPRRSSSYTPPQQLSPAPVGLSDPITAGIITDADAKMIFDAIFLRLNPFINLFDPALHTVSYVRSKCPFLFTALLMGGCKFFMAEKYRQCQKLANEFATRAFAESWKRVEVVQAFACMTYWKEPDDTRTWTFIGYACRMAVELNLNRFVANPPPYETEFQRLERRNRERTYLVLFVHDRSLSMQCNKHWMLPVDDFIKNAGTWHERSGTIIRPEDVVAAAFVALRRIAAETTDTFQAGRSSSGHNNADINYELVLTNCNSRLTDWDDHWRNEMHKAGGQKFHDSFLTFFRLHVRIFLNSYGIRATMHHGNRQPPSMQALSACTTSALDSLRIACEDFHDIYVLRYGQDSITVMTAYSAITLLKLLRDTHTKDHISPVIANEIHALISKTADSYQEASAQTQISISASFHARFLRNLVIEDVNKHRRPEPERNEESMPIDPRLQAPPPALAVQTSPSQVYPHPGHRTHEPPPQSYQFPTSPSVVSPAQGIVQDEYQMDIQARTGAMNASTVQAIHYPNGYVPVPQHASELDAHYWKNMFLELGFGEGVDPSLAHMVPMRPMPHYMEQQQQQQQHPQHQHQQHHAPQLPHPAQAHQVMHPQGPMHYQAMHTSAHQPYGH